ncbi:Alpha/Beta hydrolase protein [Coniochaeta sp. 2T2.1]|nr:Alpha/Beta hydrolase protein [Coniochaeta sp. 2T2.1]
MAPPNLLPNLPPPPGTYTSLALGTALGLTLAYLLRSPLFTSYPASSSLPGVIPAPSPPSPSSSVPHPYPPNVLPGRRPFRTPYGTINIYEFGSPTGEKVLFLPGIGTPVLALGDMALRLAETGGYRVMLFDLFGRGYSDCPTGVEFDGRLYAAQILMVLASSDLSWTGSDGGFHLVGYSLGGGLAVDFARYFGHLVRSLVVVANGGLVRRDRHVGWKSRVLYGRGWLPEWLLEWAVRRRIRPSKGGGPDEIEADHDVRGVGGKTDHDANGGKGWDSTLLSKRGESQMTVADVMDWQVREHKGFVRAFRSSIRCAPIYDQGEEWREVRAMLELRRRREDKNVPGLRRGKVLMVLGRTDSVVVLEEVVEDARRALGEDGVEVVVLEGGHEVAFTHGVEVADAAMRFWREDEGGVEEGGGGGGD